MKVTRPIKRINSFGFCLFLAAHPLAFAEPSPSAAAVPVEHASFHQLVFADEDIAILNNLYPPKGDSGFHTSGDLESMSGTSSCSHHMLGGGDWGDPPASIRSAARSFAPPPGSPLQNYRSAGVGFRVARDLD